MSRLTAFAAALSLVLGCEEGTRREDISYVKDAPSPLTPLQPVGQRTVNPEHGFSIELPKGWGPIPQSYLTAHSKAVSNSGSQVRYIAGYYVLANENPFTHPFIGVSKLPESAMPRSSLSSMRRLVRSSQDTIEKKLEKESGSLVRNVNIGVPALEEKTGIVWFKMQGDAPDGTRCEGLTANYYTRSDILQFTAATTAERGKDDWPVLETILRSVRLTDHVKPKQARPWRP